MFWECFRLRSSGTHLQPEIIGECPTLRHFWIKKARIQSKIATKGPADFSETLHFFPKCGLNWRMPNKNQHYWRPLCPQQCMLCKQGKNLNHGRESTEKVTKSPIKQHSHASWAKKHTCFTAKPLNTQKQKLLLGKLAAVSVIGTRETLSFHKKNKCPKAIVYWMVPSWEISPVRACTCVFSSGFFETKIRVFALKENFRCIRVCNERTFYQKTKIQSNNMTRPRMRKRLPASFALNCTGFILYGWAFPASSIWLWFQQSLRTNMQVTGVWCGFLWNLLWEFAVRCRRPEQKGVNRSLRPSPDLSWKYFFFGPRMRFSGSILTPRLTTENVTSSSSLSSFGGGLSGP